MSLITRKLHKFQYIISLSDENLNKSEEADINKIMSIDHKVSASPGSEMWDAKLSLGGNMALGKVRADSKMTKGNMVRMRLAT
jgi:hypothetical protein